MPTRIYDDNIFVYCEENGDYEHLYISIEDTIVTMTEVFRRGVSTLNLSLL